MRTSDIKKSKDNIQEKDDPCWDGYEMVGMKKKGKKKVPNCVPKESVEEYVDESVVKEWKDKFGDWQGTASDKYRRMGADAGASDEGWDNEPSKQSSYNRHVRIEIGGKPWKVVAHVGIARKIIATLAKRGKTAKGFYTDEPISEAVVEKEERPAAPDADRAKRRKEIEAHQQRRREMGDDYWNDEAGDNGKPKKRRMGGRYGYGASDDEINESHRINKMKEELNTQLNEGVLDATDDDGWMAKSQLYKAAKYAIALHGMIKDSDELPAWIQSKITTISDDLGDVKHFLEYAQMSGNEMSIDSPDVPIEDDYQLAPTNLESAANEFYESVKKKLK